MKPVAIPMFVGSVVDAGRGAELENRLGHACGALQAVVEAYKGYRAPVSEESVPRGGAVDGGAGVAFEVTMNNLLSRIDRISADDDLWKVPRRARNLNFREARARIELMEAQSRAALEGDRPSHKYAVQLAYMDHGHFMAFLPTRNGSCLAGFGRSAEEAMRSFDLEWRKHNPEFTPIEEPQPGIVGPVPDPEEETSETPAPPKKPGAGKHGGPEHPTADSPKA